MGGFQPWHWAILAVVVVLLFGAKRLPDAARSLGKSMRIFKSEVRELNNDGKQDEPPATTVQSERVESPTTPPAGPNHTEARPA